MLYHTKTENIYQSLLEMNNLLVREVTPSGLFACLSKYFQEHLKCDRISLSIYNQEKNSLEWFSPATGMILNDFDAGNAGIRGPLARMAIESERVVFVPRLEEYANDDAVRYMLNAGLRSAISLPLSSRGMIIAAIVVSFTRYLDESDKQNAEIFEKMCPQIAIAVDNMLIHNKLNNQNKFLHKQVESLLQAENIEHASTEFFYSCSTMQNIMHQLRTLAGSDVPVLICGETGTGKEYLARYIHNESPRSGFNFVKVSCPALSPSLFESELFGHVKGAFTGAGSRRLGRFELADKGSIFLDEIGELEIMLQAKLLHVLQDATFERVGESKSVSVDTRCISATNADLHSMMRAGSFRRDLFYRMGVATVYVPALRDREGEIGPMLDYLLNLHAKGMNIDKANIHSDALKLLTSYEWPGNVRELSNLVRRLLVLHSGDLIGPEHVMPLLDSSNDFAHNDHKSEVHKTEKIEFLPAERIQTDSHDAIMALSDIEKKHIEDVLKKTCGRVSGPLGAAKLLNVPRSTLQYKLKKFNINPRKFKSN